VFSDRSPAQSPAGQKHDLLLENFQLVDVETGDIRREQLLLIDGDRIAFHRSEF
jgi:hypothetical protein